MVVRGWGKQVYHIYPDQTGNRFIPYGRLPSLDATTAAYQKAESLTPVVKHAASWMETKEPMGSWVSGFDRRGDQEIVSHHTVWAPPIWSRPELLCGNAAQQTSNLPSYSLL